MTPEQDWQLIATEFGWWKAGEECPSVSWNDDESCRACHSYPEWDNARDILKPHPKPLPPLTAEYMVMVLEKLAAQHVSIELYFNHNWPTQGRRDWECQLDGRLGPCTATPLEAVIAATAAYLRAQKD